MGAFAAPSSLLSLTGQVEDIILSHLSSAEGGAQAILNLRLVCSTTKMWVDTLRPREAKYVFSTQHVKVELSEERLEEFLLAPPPPPGVTSLYLTQTDFLADHRFPQEKYELWSRFLKTVSRWKPKLQLECLEIDQLSIPVPRKIVELISLPSIRSFRCQSIKQIKSREELPKFLFQFEELSVKHLHLRDSAKRIFFEKLGCSQNLKKLEVFCTDANDLKNVTSLIKLKKNEKNFHLSLQFSSFLSDGKDANFGLRMDLLLSRFAFAAVVDSSSSIQIRGIHDDQLSILHRLRLNLLTRNPFQKNSIFDNIRGISVFVPYGSLKLANFRNLESVESLDDDPENLENEAADYFPPYIRRLGVSSGFPRPISLPSMLTHLDIRHCELSVESFLRSTSSLPLFCRHLQSLKIFWRPKPSLETLPTDFQSDNQFESLKELHFMATIPDETYIPLCRMILLGVFHVHQMSLTELKLRFYSTQREPLRVVDSNVLDTFVTGLISKSLRKIEIEKCFVTEEAFSLLATLVSTASANKTNWLESNPNRRKKEEA